MPIPDYQSLMLTVVASSKGESGGTYGMNLANFLS